MAASAGLSSLSSKYPAGTTQRREVDSGSWGQRFRPWRADRIGLCPRRRTAAPFMTAWEGARERWGRGRRNAPPPPAPTTSKSYSLRSGGQSLRLRSQQGLGLGGLSLGLRWLPSSCVLKSAALDTHRGLGRALRVSCRRRTLTPFHQESPYDLRTLISSPETPSPNTRVPPFLWF